VKNQNFKKIGLFSLLFGKSGKNSAVYYSGPTELFFAPFGALRPNYSPLATLAATSVVGYGPSILS
jgi:hypothetical protein